MSSLNSIVSLLKNAGLTGTTLTGAISSIVGNSPNTAVRNICTTILANSGDTAIVSAEIIKLAEVPNLPAAVNALIPTLRTSTTPLQVVQAIQAIEASLGTQSFFNFG